MLSSTARRGPCLRPVRRALSSGARTPAPTPDAASLRAVVASLPRPSAIATHLDAYVVGQQRAKRTLAVALHAHYKRVAACEVRAHYERVAAQRAAAAEAAAESQEATSEEAVRDPRLRESRGESPGVLLARRQKGAVKEDGALVPRGLDLPAVLEPAGGEMARAREHVELDKSNVLLCGSTGSGKTLLARTLARAIKVPFAIADATSLTAAGARASMLRSNPGVTGRLVFADFFVSGLVQAMWAATRTAFCGTSLLQLMATLNVRKEALCTWTRRTSLLPSRVAPALAVMLVAAMCSRRFSR